MEVTKENTVTSDNLDIVFPPEPPEPENCGSCSDDPAVGAEPEMARFGAYMKQNRVAREVTGDELARRLGVSLRTIWRWERGAMPSAWELWRWCDALGIDFGNYAAMAFQPERCLDTLTARFMRACTEVDGATAGFLHGHTGPAPADPHYRLVLSAARNLQAAARVMVDALTQPEPSDVMPSEQAEIDRKNAVLAVRQNQVPESA